MDFLVYDIEIDAAIPPSNGAREPGIRYCDGWDDHYGMGIACIGAYDSREDRYRVFGSGEELFAFKALLEDRAVGVTFNGVRFDNKVIAAHTALPEVAQFDILRELWISKGLDPDSYSHGTHGGYSLDALARCNDLGSKTGRGDLAPIWWQRGHYCRVVDYCLQDVKLTRELFDLVARGVPLKCPKGGREITLDPSLVLGMPF